MKIVGKNMTSIVLRLSWLISQIRHSVYHRIKGLLWGHMSYKSNFFFSMDASTSGSTLEVHSEHSVNPNLYASPDWIFYGSSTVSTRRIFTLSPGIVDGASGRVYDADRKFLADSSAWNPLHASFRWPAPLRKRFPRNLDLDDKVTFIPNQGFYHWLIEDFPSVLRIKKQLPSTLVLVRADANKFIVDMLRLAGINYSLAPIEFVANHLVVETKPPALVPQISDLEQLKDFQANLIVTSEPDRRIFISRNDAWRMPENNDELEDLIRKLGFQVLQLTQLEPLEQISLFSQATIVVGLHGAGMANLAWCSPKTSVVEISFEGQPPCYEILSSITGLSYFREVSPKSDPWTVDLLRLEKLLCLLMEKK